MNARNWPCFSVYFDADATRSMIARNAIGSAPARRMPVCQNESLSMAAKHNWAFRPRLRAGAFGWHGSRLACQRLKEAVAEIKKAARVDSVTAADGGVTLME
jgi:hypothetical protein